MKTPSYSTWHLAYSTSKQWAEWSASGKLVVLVPVGSVEPHGPHLSLCTDTVLSEHVCELAAQTLGGHGWLARIAPAVPYGVTECAQGFAGSISVSAQTVTAFLREVVQGFLAQGARHVCLVNNHLEPGQDSALRDAVSALPKGQASVACPLTRKWARTLSDEFKSGACHAGEYETSMILAIDPSMNDEALRPNLPKLDISLSQKLAAGMIRFSEMGMSEAYTGDPASATAAKGQIQLALLRDMVVGEVTSALANP